MVKNEAELVKMFEPWMLAAIDDAGYNGIRDETELQMKFIKQDLLKLTEKLLTVLADEHV